MLALELFLLYFIPWLILVIATYFIMKKPANLYNLLFDPCENSYKKDDSTYCCIWKWIPIGNICFIIIFALVCLILLACQFTEVCVEFFHSKCAPFLKKYLSKIVIK